jgi:hypothetical protein
VQPTWIKLCSIITCQLKAWLVQSSPPSSYQSFPPLLLLQVNLQVYPRSCMLSECNSLGLSGQSILFGWVNLPCSLYGSSINSCRYSGRNSHVESEFVPEIDKLLGCHQSCWKGLVSAC